MYYFHNILCLVWRLQFRTYPQNSVQSPAVINTALSCTDKSQFFLNFLCGRGVLSICSSSMDLLLKVFPRSTFRSCELFSLSTFMALFTWVTLGDSFPPFICLTLPNNCSNLSWLIFSLKTNSTPGIWSRYLARPGKAQAEIWQRKRNY